MYFGMISEEHPLPSEFNDWALCEQYGWTLEYVRNLSVGDLRDRAAIIDGRNKAKGSILK